MTTAPAHTILYDWHVAQQARMVEFGGWMMPVQYSSIADEHHATRRALGVFDISHMGRLRLEGAGAVSFLDRLLTRRVSGIGRHKIRYSLVTNESGGILDDVLIYHLVGSGGDSFYLLVVNASNRIKIASWIQEQLRDSEGVSMVDQTLETAMIAVQGPKALEVISPLVAAPLSSMEYYTGVVSTISDSPAIVSRTGYTGEDGCELIVSASVALEIWNKILASGKEQGAKPAGLGARDTLRLEAAMPLYGHELSEQINPFQAGLSFAVNLQRDFIGRDALVHAKEAVDRRRVGLELGGKRIAREHYPVVHRDQRIGEITSGTFSPTLEKAIAMAYVRPDLSAVGTELAVEIRGKLEPARVVPLPFYRRKE